MRVNRDAAFEGAIERPPLHDHEPGQLDATPRPGEVKRRADGYDARLIEKEEETQLGARLVSVACRSWTTFQ